MGIEWHEAKLTDLYKVSSGLSKAAKYFGSGYPFLAFKDVFNNFFIPDQLSQLVQSSEQEQRKCSVKRGDVFLTRTSETMDELGMSTVALKDYDRATFNGFTKRLRPKENNNLVPEYVGYYLRSPKFRQEMLAFSTMSTRASLNNEMISRLSITYPSVETQNVIGGILKTLDDKLALNHQVNTTLESMAQTLFKSWFVDFDPVVDNALAAGNPIPEDLQARADARAALGNQRKPLPDHIRQQFPDRFVLTEEMGWVPEGWAFRSFTDVFNLLGGHAFKSGEYVENGEYGIVTIKNVQDGKFVQECTNRLSTVPRKMKEHCILNRGDILLSLTGNVGRVCIVPPGPYLLNQRVAKLVGKNGISSGFIYYFFRQKPVFEKLLTIAKGTAQLNLSPIETGKLKQVLPDNNTITALQSEFEVLLAKTLTNIAQNQALAGLRDTLLPKLLSGELQIPEAEKQVEEVI